MNSPRHVVIVGAGRVGRVVLEDLPSEWAVTVVDTSADVLAALPPRAGRTDVLGDATSRLVLAGCVLDTACTLVVATDSDDVNLEVARVAGELGVEEIVTILHDAARAPREISAVSRVTVTAAQVLNRVGIGETRSESIGLGRGELRQVTVLAGSPAIGRPLRQLNAGSWLVAAVYRSGRLIVPHGHTEVGPGDQVLLVGEPTELTAIASFFRGGAATFPAAYGSRLGCIGVGTAVSDMARWLAVRTAVRDVVDLPGSLLDPGITPPASLAAALRTSGIGCLVVEPRNISWAARLGFVGTAWPHQLIATGIPVLVTRGRPVAKRVLVAIGPDHDARVIGGAAIDLARQLDAPLRILTVLPAVISPEAENSSDPSRDLLAFARLHGVEPARLLDRGNPIERIRHHVAPDDLLVLGHSRTRRNTVFTPDVSTWLLHHAPCSTLFVPWARRESVA